MVAFTKPTTVNEVWASAGIISAPTNLKITQGWTVEIPPYQYFNWSQNRVDSFIAHVNQFGISQWDNTTEYQAGKSLVQGADGTVYRALTTNTNKLPSTNPSDWSIAFESYGVVSPVQTQLNTLQTNYNTLANLTNYAQARNNLSVYSKTESDGRFAAINGSASNVFKVATAVSNDDAVPLGQINSLFQQATTVNVGITRYGTQSEIAQGTLTNVALSAKTAKDNYLMRSNNLSDLTNITAAKNTLGIKDVGTTSGTIAAGDDSRIVNAVPNTRSVSTGNGLVGGGSLNSNLTISLGTPGTVNSTSGNSVSTSGHTHALDITSFFANRSLAEEGFYIFPGGFTIQWGAVYSIPTDGLKSQAFPRPFDAVFQVIGSKRNHTPVEGDGNSCGAYAANNAYVVGFNDSNRYANSISYVAFGWCNV